MHSSSGLLVWFVFVVLPFRCNPIQTYLVLRSTMRDSVVKTRLFLFSLIWAEKCRLRQVVSRLSWIEAESTWNCRISGLIFGLCRLIQHGCGDIHSRSFFGGSKTPKIGWIATTKLVLSCQAHFGATHVTDCNSYMLYGSFRTFATLLSKNCALKSLLSLSNGLWIRAICGAGFCLAFERDAASRPSWLVSQSIRRVLVSLWPHGRL